MVFRVSSLSEKGVGQLNEDVVLLDREYQIFGVFDGATSLDKYVSPDGKTGAFMAAEAAAQAFSQPEIDLGTTALRANAQIEQVQIATGMDLRNSANRFGTAAAVLRIVDKTGRLLQIGDCAAVVITKDGQVSAPLGREDHDVEFKRRWKQLAATNSNPDEVRNQLTDFVFAQRNAANTEYGLLNGDPKARNFIKTGKISLDGVAAILLLTDGMYLPSEDPAAEEDWKIYTDLYARGGLKAIYETVRGMEASDPNHTKYPRYKTHDDASGVAIDFH